MPYRPHVEEELRPIEDLDYYPGETLSIKEAAEFVPIKEYALYRFTHEFLIPTVLEPGSLRRRVHKWTIVGLRERRIVPPRVPRESSGLDTRSLLRRREEHSRARDEEPAAEAQRKRPRRQNKYGLSVPASLALLDKIAAGMPEADALAEIRKEFPEG